MEVFCKLNAKTGTSDNRLRIVNEVRLWLRVITIAELADADGACISPEKLDGRWRNDSTPLWPNIPKPSEKMFEIFRLYVRKSLCRNVKHHHRGERLTVEKDLERGTRSIATPNMNGAVPLSGSTGLMSILMGMSTRLGTESQRL